MIYIGIFLISFLFSFFLSPLTIKISNKFNIFSKNNSGGKGKPCLGGIAIFIAFLAGCSPVYLLNQANLSGFNKFIIPCAIVVLLGIIDDIKELRPFQKIFGQLIAIGILIMWGVFTKISFLPLWLNILITLFWMLFIINAFNLLDIVDGLTSGLVIIISLTLLAVSLVNKDTFSSIVLIALIGANLGFLKHNYPPAKLYMGDTGSLLSGFILAGISINISYASIDRPIALITPLLAMSLAVYDTLFLIIMRIKKNKPIFSKSDDHFALRLITLGYSERKSLWIMYIFSIFLALSSIAVAFGPNIAGITVLVLVFTVFILMGKKVGISSV